jgi:predicted nucleic acid-binding protein
MDSDVLIALLKAGLVRILHCFSELEFIITETNYAEINREKERFDLDLAISKGDLKVVELNTPASLTKFAGLLKYIDPGEAAVITLAALNGAHVAMHDRVGRRIAITQLSGSRVHRLEDIIVDAVRNGCISLEEANDSTNRLKVANDYLPSFANVGIKEVLSNPEFGIIQEIPNNTGVS